jgi:hypothetical protein
MGRPLSATKLSAVSPLLEGACRLLKSGDWSPQASSCREGWRLPLATWVLPGAYLMRSAAALVVLRLGVAPLGHVLRVLESWVEVLEVLGSGLLAHCTVHTHVDRAEVAIEALQDVLEELDDVGTQLARGVGAVVHQELFDSAADRLLLVLLVLEVSDDAVKR